jgi:hypothetical protein
MGRGVHADLARVQRSRHQPTVPQPHDAARARLYSLVVRPSEGSRLVGHGLNLARTVRLIQRQVLAAVWLSWLARKRSFCLLQSPAGQSAIKRLRFY